MSPIWPAERPESVYQAFVQAEGSYGDRPFLCVLPEVATVYGLQAGELTYTEARVWVERWAARFAAAGYGRGHRVGLLLENRPGYFLMWFALNSLGVSVVPINPDLRLSELKYLIEHSEIAAAIVVPSRKKDIEDAARMAQRAVTVLGPEDEVAPAA